MADRLDVVVAEGLGERAPHEGAVLDHVGEPRGAAQVVLEHPPEAVVVADEVDPRHVHEAAERRLDSGHRADIPLAGGDEPVRHDPVGHGPPLAVDVGDEAVERAHPLRQAGLELGPLVGGDQPRQQVERERLLAAAVVEGDALAEVGAVDQRRARHEGRRPQRAQARVQPPVRLARQVGPLEHLVEEPVDLVVREQRQRSPPRPFPPRTAGPRYQREGQPPLGPWAKAAVAGFVLGSARASQIVITTVAPAPISVVAR